MTDDTLKLAEHLNSVMGPRGYIATAGKYASGNCAEFIRFSRPQSPNRKCGEIVRTENGWNTSGIDGLVLSKLVESLVNRDVSASVASDNERAEADRLDNQ